MMKIIVDFHNFANAPKNPSVLISRWTLNPNVIEGSIKKTVVTNDPACGTTDQRTPSRLGSGYAKYQSGASSCCGLRNNTT
jgi:hypothetical protein